MDKKQKTVNKCMGCAQKMYSFYVAECMEFKILGMEYRGLSLEEAVKKYRRIPTSKRVMIQGIGITIQTREVKEAVEGLQRLMPELKVIAVRE